MKNFILIICLVLFISCKTDNKEAETEKEQVSESLQVIKGSYLYYTDVAILQTSNEVYGVVLDENAKTLNKKVAPFKTKDTDMVPVEIKGNIVSKTKGEEGWPFKIQIKEILKVSKPLPENKDIITLGN